MTKAQDTASDDWLSAPVGNSPAADSSAQAGKSSKPAKSSKPGKSSDAGQPADAASAKDSSAVSESVTSTGSKYKSSFTKSLAAQGSAGSVYPSTGSASVATGSPALEIEPTPGPATSVGLGSAATSTSNRVRRAAAGPRRAKLQIRHIDPWSTLKLTLVLSVAFFFVWMIAVAILYGVLSTMGVFESIDSMFAELGGQTENIVTPKIVFGGAALIGAINIVLFTALATIGAYIYNLCADLAGGLEITLAERR